MHIVAPRPLPHGSTVLTTPGVLARYADELRSQLEQLQQHASSDASMKPAEPHTHPIAGGADGHHSSDMYTPPSQRASFVLSHSQQSSISSSSTATFRPSVDRDRSIMKDDDGETSASRFEGQVESVLIPSEPGLLPTVCLHPSEVDSLGEQYGPLTKDQHLSLQSLSLSDIENLDSLSDLDIRDDRGDPDGIVSKRLTRNELLRRISALSGASSIWSTSQYDPIRASVQTYGSSVLTYGSRASQYLGDESPDGDEGDRDRPSAPLPWVPRPSALDRIHHVGQVRGRARSGSGSSASGRPLPPIPTPISSIAPSSIRDRSMSVPALMRSDSNSSASVYSVSSVSSSVRRLPRPSPRPLPQTPQSMVSRLPDINEGEVAPSRPNSMFLSPTEAHLPFEGGRSKSGRQRFSTIGYGHHARGLIGARALFEDKSENQTCRKKNLHSRSASCMSSRSSRSVYFVPDVDELVRILDSMEDSGSSPSSGSSADEAPVTPTAGPRLSSSQKKGGDESSVPWKAVPTNRVNTPVEVTGLPTPAATPRSSPQRQPSTLPRAIAKEASNSTDGVQRELSPVPTSAGGVSLTNFPLPPPALGIMAPEAIGADDIPIPSASVGEPSPSMGKSFAEQATLPGMELFLKSREDRTPTPPRATRTFDAIKDLKQRVSILPGTMSPPSPPKNPIGKYGPVPLLSQPVPPRRRNQSTITNAQSSTSKKSTVVPSIDVKAANAFPKNSMKYGVGKPPIAASAPIYGMSFEDQAPQIIYTTPAPVAPLRIRRTSSATSANLLMSSHVPPMATVPQSASAMQTSFQQTKSVVVPSRPQRAQSFCVSPGGTAPSVAPLRLRTGGPSGSRGSSTTLNTFFAGQDYKSFSDSKPVEEAPVKLTVVVSTDDGYESDQLRTPTNADEPDTPTPRVADGDDETGTGLSILSVGSALSAINNMDPNASIDPAFADIIKSIAGASEEEQMGSLLTLASSIHTDHHASGYNAGFNLPFVLPNDEKEEDYVDVDVDERSPSSGKAVSRKSTASSASERRRSKGRSINSIKKRQSIRSAAAVRAAIRALPDPSTFPIPTSAGSVASNNSAAASANDFAGFVRPSPLPKLNVVTKFKGNIVLLPASHAPLSAVSTKSSMSLVSSNMSTAGHSRSGSTVGHGSEGRISKRISVIGGPRKMNRLTLTDPRSPMADAAVAAAALVARVREKRAALVQRGTMPGSGTGNRQNGQRALGHQRTNSGSSGTLRSKLKMSGSGFFGSSVRSTTEHDTVMRSGPRARLPTLKISRSERDAAATSFNGDVVLDLCT